MRILKKIIASSTEIKEHWYKRKKAISQNLMTVNFDKNTYKVASEIRFYMSVL